MNEGHAHLRKIISGTLHTNEPHLRAFQAPIDILFSVDPKYCANLSKFSCCFVLQAQPGSKVKIFDEGSNVDTDLT